VSKDVQKLRDYESALLKHYQAYLKLLLEGALQSQGGTRAGVGHARVAVRCMCQLLTAHPHFNYT
jgi:nucleolar complex protein 3